MSTTEIIPPAFTAKLRSAHEVWILEDGTFADQVERMVGESTDEMMERAERRCEMLASITWR